uniref:Mucin-like protein n=1 Tax=Sogatella furcifera TaxID=113103 RepID=A0A1S5VJZ1_SOGFU|nr:mucin-like protein [Sogatella furcifera]
MRCFSVIALLAACISAASCYGMGYSSGGFGAESIAQSQNYGAAMESQSYQAASSEQSESFQESASSFNSGQQYAAGAANYAQAGAYGVAGAAGGAYGAAGAYGAGYGAASEYAGYGAQAANYASGSYQSSKYAKSSSSSSISSASSSSAVAASSSSCVASLSYYPKLSQIPFFASCFNALSAEENYASLWGSDFNVQRTLSSMFESNALFKNYFCSATGINFSRYQASELSRVYSAFSYNKADFVRLVRNYARHGYVYNTNFANTILSMQSSLECFSAASKFSSFSSVQTWNQIGLTKLFASSYYQRYIASFCGMSTWDEAIATRTLSNYFRTNAAATSLFFRHLLLNRVSTSVSYQQYAALSSQSYMSARSQYFNYCGNYQQYISQSSSSSFARSQSYSASSASSVSSASSYSAMSASSTKSFSSVSQYYGSTFASSSLFKSCFALETCETSSEARFYGSAFSQGYDFASAYSTVLQDTYFRQYLLGCTGVYSVDAFSGQVSSQFFKQYATRYPGWMARTTKLYARNGAFFSSSLGRFFLTCKSEEFFSQSISQYRSSLLSVQSWNTCGLSALLQSRYYQRKLTTFFGFSTFDYNQVSSAMCRLFSTNLSGGMLALRHLIYRKYIGQSFAVSSYMGLNSYSYASSLAYRCPFYSSWSSYYRQYSQQSSSYARSSSFSRSQSQSSMQQSQQSYQAAGAASGYSAGSAAGAAYGGGYSAW